MDPMMMQQTPQEAPQQPPQGPPMMQEQGPMPPPMAGPQSAPVDGDDNPQAEQQFETILAGLLEFIVGKGSAGIEKQLKDAKNVPEAIGQITFTLIEEASQQAQQAQQELDMDVLFGVAAEVIDSLIRVAQKLGKDIQTEEAREEAMMSALQAFLMTSKADPEQQEIAKQMLAEMAAEGDTDMAAAELQRMGQRAGVDPFAEEGPQQKPLAKAAKFSMMGGPQ
jgi:hypothetical protein